MAVIYDATRPADHTVVNGPGPAPQPDITVACTTCDTTASSSMPGLAFAGWVWVRGTHRFFCPDCCPPGLEVIVR